MNPFAVSPRKHTNHEFTTELLCPVCGRSQLHPGHWRVCISCDEAMGVPMNDAPPETMRAWTGVGVWPAPVAGRA